MNKDTKTNETQAQKLNFHDLIDAAMQAYKDGFLTSITDSSKFALMN